MKTKLALFLAASTLAVTTAFAAVQIPTVYVGDSGNPADPENEAETPFIGSVPYSYHISSHPVTNAEYATFLNSAAKTDPHKLYNPAMGGSGGGIIREGRDGEYTYTATEPDKSVNFLSYWSAVRFVNWLSTGDTESGKAEHTIVRNERMWGRGGVAIATENEWYKAAYYSGSSMGAGGDGYWLFANQTNVHADPNTPSDGTESDGRSYYGTTGQGGEMGELNESMIASGGRGMRGGSLDSNREDHPSSFHSSMNPEHLFTNVGFRITSLVPIFLRPGTIPPDEFNNIRTASRRVYRNPVTRDQVFSSGNFVFSPDVDVISTIE